MMIYDVIERENYIRDNNFKKKCSLYLYCCQYDLYENAIQYYNQFMCYCCRMNHVQL